ncbi:LysR family transcriptional regulator [Mesorhizobium retamae]|uniref:LysR family transcriptional regulator n=1 Tax=Mesorhizobium retamae TaxID=2912854 RepID=A0ABS9QEV4_9HYPH|nr:LysR family transcriptional regulator [Mesorhizobium sp. IRAMC:0171]MCG7505326.1 LysR family transcriptional regulator [Mesorhizobium sp. IRAMC:0171]
MANTDDPGFELRHLRYVVATAELGGIRRAARRLGVDPGAVSRRIQDLENEIGAALFIRGQGGVTLTFAGERFLQQARKALSLASHAVQDAGVIGQGQAGVIRIGVISSLASGFLPELVESYKAHHAAVRLEYVEAGPEEHVPAVQQHRLDVAFLTGQPIAEGCDLAHLWNERVFVAMSDRHELAGKQDLAWSDLQGQRFVVSEVQPGPEIADYLVKHLSALGRSPTIDHQAVYRDNLMQIVAGGHHLTLTSEATIATQFSGLVYRPLAGEVLPFCAVWSPKNDNPAFRRLLSLAKMLSKKCGACLANGKTTHSGELLQSPDP